MTDWMRELPAEVLVCDKEGRILSMNKAAEELFAEDGGGGLIGSNVLECHPEPARSKLAGMLATQANNAYSDSEDGKKRFFYQAAWYREGEYAGFVEISFPVPEEIPHFKRG